MVQSKAWFRNVTSERKDCTCICKATVCTNEVAQKATVPMVALSRDDPYTVLYTGSLLLIFAAIILAMMYISIKDAKEIEFDDNMHMIRRRAALELDEQERRKRQDLKKQMFERLTERVESSVRSFRKKKTLKSRERLESDHTLKNQYGAQQSMIYEPQIDTYMYESTSIRC